MAKQDASPFCVAGPARSAILQVHPSLLCNLTCSHCYSNSGPKRGPILKVEALCQTISDAAALGYRVVSVSGGEPFLYPGLVPVLRCAKANGLRTAITTNGFSLGSESAASTFEFADILAISVDGPPEIHNSVRGSDQAFAFVERAVERARGASVPFGLIYTLTSRNWQYVPWAAEFAVKIGARLLQIHPLELSGRASSFMTEQAISIDTLCRVYVLTAVLSLKYQGVLELQIDVFHQEHLRTDPALVYAKYPICRDVTQKAANVLGILVLEPDGGLVPVAYGLSRKYQVCNVNERRLSEAWPEYFEKDYGRFAALCYKTWMEMCSTQAPVLCNWHEAIVGRSHLM